MLNEDVRESIRQAAAIIRDSRYLVAFTGAGISTDSGIPDFRSQDSGVWRGVDPLVVASIYGFRQNPQAFYDWVRPLSELTFNAQPNPAHHALFDLESAGYLRSVITQNIDMLHTRAGHQRIFELHGHMRQATCIHCFAVCDGDRVMRQFLADRRVPRCNRCGDGVLKPNVVLFGEQLPFRELQGAQAAARDCDVMMVVGSSLEVAPADGIPLLAQRTGGKLIIVNLEPTPADAYADVVIRGRAAHILPEIVRYVEKSE